MSGTLHYYNQNAQAFVKSTRDVDFYKTQIRFLDRLLPHSYILDFGCGSGRDTRYFLSQGYLVDAVDGSKEICKLASAYTGIQIQQMLFQELAAENLYDLGMFFHIASAIPGVKNGLNKDGERFKSRWNCLYFF